MILMIFDKLDSWRIARTLTDGESKAARIEISSSSHLRRVGLLCNTSEDLDIICCLTRKMNKSIDCLNFMSDEPRLSMDLVTYYLLCRVIDDHACMSEQLARESLAAGSQCSQSWQRQRQKATSDPEFTNQTPPRMSFICE
jgi:hypothetical protein